MMGQPDLILQVGPALLVIVESGRGVSMGRTIEVMLIGGGGDWEWGWKRRG